MSCKSNMYQENLFSFWEMLTKDANMNSFSAPWAAVLPIKSISWYVAYYFPSYSSRDSSVIAISSKQLLTVRQLVSYDCHVGYGLITVSGFVSFCMLVTDCLQVFLFSVCMTPNTVDIYREDFSLAWLLKRLHMKEKKWIANSTSSFMDRRTRSTI